MEQLATHHSHSTRSSSILGQVALNASMTCMACSRIRLSARSSSPSMMTCANCLCCLIISASRTPLWLSLQPIRCSVTMKSSKRGQNQHRWTNHADAQKSHQADQAICDLPRLIPITLEMHGIFGAKPKEQNDSNGLNGGGNETILQPHPAPTPITTLQVGSRLFGSAQFRLIAPVIQRHLQEHRH